jgi:hypothetical protein
MIRVPTLLLLVLALVSFPALAQHEHEHFDARHGHARYYASPGHEVAALPAGAVEARFHDEHYWFHGGVWYHPVGPRWVVIAPPIGLYVSVLPSFYTTLVIGGVPYYYANDTYYAFDSGSGQYQVVAPPPGAEAASAATPAAPAAERIFIYPRNGQSESQQAQDRYECHRWAADQSGFDPTQPGGGVAPELANAKRADYGRAMGACLESRAYTVR